MQGVLALQTLFLTEVLDFKAMAGSADAQQIANIENAYVLTFDAGSKQNGLTFSVIEFDSEPTAKARFKMVKSQTGPLPLQPVTPQIADDSAELLLNAQGIGSIVAFRKGRSYVSLRTAQTTGEEPLIGLDKLRELARIVASRLQ